MTELLISLERLEQTEKNGWSAELEEENKTLRKRIDNMQADFDLKVKYMNADFADEMVIYAQACESDAEQTYRTEIIELQRQVRDLKNLAGLREDD